jgi:outer membrane lipopolysaccharide assembly protein LptE/RlpB
MTKFRNFCVITVLLLAFPACGYHFSGGGDLPGGVQRVAMGVIENRSGESGVDGIVSNDIVNEFTRNGKNITYQAQGAEATLAGTVLSVTTDDITRLNALNVSERRVTMKISLKLTDSEGTVLWQKSGLSESEDYMVAGDTESNKREAIKELSIRLAEKVYYQITDDF